MSLDETIVATQSLAVGNLRVELRIEVLPAHPSIFPALSLSNERANAMETLPDVLRTVAPPLLRQILEEAEQRLVVRSAGDHALSFSLSCNENPNNGAKNEPNPN